LGPTPSQVSSLSAPPSPDVTNRVPALPRSVPRFSQPLDRTYAVNDLRVYSTPLALLGSWPSESYHVIDRAPSLATLLLRRHPFFTVFFGCEVVVPATWPRRCYPERPSPQQPLTVETVGSRLELGPTLKLFSRCRALPTRSSFTHHMRSHLSWPLLLRGLTDQCPGPQGPLPFMVHRPRSTPS
jgi:hypothetical protein